MHDCLAHRQVRKLRGDPDSEIGRSKLSGRAQLAGTARQVISQPVEADLQLIGTIICPLELNEPGRGLLAPRQDVVDGVAVLAL